jgi:hypothetical protein
MKTPYIFFLFLFFMSGIARLSANEECPVNDCLITAPNVDCTETPGLFYFSFNLFEPDPQIGCPITLLSINGGGTIDLVSPNPAVVTGANTFVEGFVQLGGTVPGAFVFAVYVGCGDPETDCRTEVVFEIPPCCQTAALDSIQLCKGQNEILTISLECTNFSATVQTINWYVATGLCPQNNPPGAGWQLVQSGSDCDFFFQPNGTFDECIVAEIFFVECDDPIYTSPAVLTVCPTITYSAEPGNQQFCLGGMPDTLQLNIGNYPFPLNTFGNPCPLFVNWYYEMGDGTLFPLEPEEDDPTLYVIEKPAFFEDENATISNGCKTVYRYIAEVDYSCFSGGPVQVAFSVEVFPEPEADLVLSDTIGCYESDTEVSIINDCSGQWTFQQSPDGQNWSEIDGAGTQNPLYYSNVLTETVCYRVIAFNDGCGEKPSETKCIEIKPPLLVTEFAVLPNQTCDPTQVKLVASVNYESQFTYEWYFNGLPIGVTISGSGAGFIYYGPLIPGNYQVRITDNLCPDETIKSEVITIDPTFDFVLGGPCYLCEGMTAQLQVIFTIPPQDPCSFLWYHNGLPIPGANSPILIVDEPGFYTAEVTCGECTKLESTFLPLCLSAQ